MRKGDELFESYQISSLKDNAHLAFMFGFTLADNAKVAPGPGPFDHNHRQTSHQPRLCPLDLPPSPEEGGR